MTLSSKHKLKIKTKDNIIFCGDSFNSTLCKCLYLNKNYEPSITEYLKNTLKKGDVFIDVGANEGVFSILAGKLVGQSGKVYCIEPLPRNITILKENVRINDLKNIVVYDVAAGEKNKNVTFYDIKFNNMMGGANNKVSNVLSKIPHLINFIKTKQKRLDELIHEPLEKIKVIKIDTEGYEEYVLKGIESWLNENCLIDFIIEMTPSKSGNVVELFLDKLKYKGYMHWMDSVAYDDKVKWEKLDKNCNFQKNVLFTKNKNIRLFC